ncbi:MAG: class I SAM-dependent methyltransferase [Nitrospirae bacterium]|nr:class I SAM-dependent methyltransferase [Nitrospirota bacterium]
MMRNKVFFLKLRSNVVLNGDIDLAEREVRAFFKQIERVSQPAQIEKKTGLPAALSRLHDKGGDCIGFIARGADLTIREMVLLLNFVQEIWFEERQNGAYDEFRQEQWFSLIEHKGKGFICLLPLMACGELLSQAKMPSPKTEDIGLLTAFLSGSTKAGKKIKAPTTGSTSTQHVHSMHKYKAKFFPRLIRSFLVEYLNKIPKNSNGKVTLLDPFVGSGTSLVEASLLGLDSAGVDIDKLSCAISQAKIDALTVSPGRVEETAQRLLDMAADIEVDKPTYKFPQLIAKKFERWGSIEEQLSYERAISKWKCAIDQIDNERLRHLFEICLSDALTRKFVIRMMGTGVGRFALEIAKTSLDTLMSSNFKVLAHSIRVARSLIDGYGIRLGNATISHGTAVKLPFDDDIFSVVITSPPYLPASSGREDYLIGKAVSNVALDLMTDTEIEETEAASVGSMKWAVAHGDGLPASVYELHDWLVRDPLREIKAKPILAYYLSLKQALKETFRVLLPGGYAFYVVGKESVFYRFSTREVLYRVECDKIFAA